MYNIERDISERKEVNGNEEGAEPTGNWTNAMLCFLQDCRAIETSATEERSEMALSIISDRGFSRGFVECCAVGLSADVALPLINGASEDFEVEDIMSEDEMKAAAEILMVILRLISGTAFTIAGEAVMKGTEFESEPRKIPTDKVGNHKSPSEYLDGTTIQSNDKNATFPLTISHVKAALTNTVAPNGIRKKALEAAERELSWSMSNTRWDDEFATRYPTFRNDFKEKISQAWARFMASQASFSEDKNMNHGASFSEQLELTGSASRANSSVDAGVVLFLVTMAEYIVNELFDVLRSHAEKTRLSPGGSEGRKLKPLASEIPTLQEEAKNVGDIVCEDASRLEMENCGVSEAPTAPGKSQSVSKASKVEGLMGLTGPKWVLEAVASDPSMNEFVSTACERYVKPR